MALKGTLKDFSISDIFQLIGQQGKSGSLFVRAKEKEAHIVFDAGKIVLATFKRSNEDFLLGTMLLRAGVITAEQLTSSIENQKSTLRSLGDILKSAGAVTSQILSEFVSLQLKEVLFRVFQWKDGLYEFIPEKIQYNKGIIRPQSAEGVLMDGFRQVDEWPQISEKVGSPEGVFQGSEEVQDGAEPDEVDTMQDQLDRAFGDFDAADAVPEPERPKERLGANEKRILRLLDGQRSLQEVIYLGRLGTFETYKAVAGLLDRGLTEKVSELSPTRVVTSSGGLRSLSLAEWLGSSIRTLAAVLLVSFSLPVLAFGLRSQWALRYVDPKRVLHESRFSFADVWERNESERVENALRLYLLQTGSFPPSLEDLAEPGLSPAWSYSRAGESYSLSLRPGGR